MYFVGMQHLREKVFSGTRLLSFQGLNYYTAEGTRAFKDLTLLMWKLNEWEIDMEWQRRTIEYLRAVKLYLNPLSRNMNVLIYKSYNSWNLVLLRLSWYKLSISREDYQGKIRRGSAISNNTQNFPFTVSIPDMAPFKPKRNKHAYTPWPYFLRLQLQISSMGHRTLQVK